MGDIKLNMSSEGALLLYLKRVYQYDLLFLLRSLKHNLFECRSSNFLHFHEPLPNHLVELYNCHYKKRYVTMMDKSPGRLALYLNLFSSELFIPGSLLRVEKGTPFDKTTRIIHQHDRGNIKYLDGL